MNKCTPGQVIEKVVLLKNIGLVVLVFVGQNNVLIFIGMKT